MTPQFPPKSSQKTTLRSPMRAKHGMPLVSFKSDLRSAAVMAVAWTNVYSSFWHPCNFTDDAPDHWQLLLQDTRIHPDTIDWGNVMRCYPMASCNVKECKPSGMLNSLWPSDTIWRQRSGSTLAQAMACCLTAPSHYLNQCWLIISGVLWHSSDNNFTGAT